MEGVIVQRHLNQAGGNSASVLNLYAAQLQIFHLYLKVKRRNCINILRTVAATCTSTKGSVPSSGHSTDPWCLDTGRPLFFSVHSKTHFLHTYDIWGRVSQESWAESPKPRARFGDALPAPRVCGTVLTLPFPHLRQDLKALSAPPRCNPHIGNINRMKMLKLKQSRRKWGSASTILMCCSKADEYDSLWYSRSTETYHKDWKMQR